MRIYNKDEDDKLDAIVVEGGEDRVRGVDYLASSELASAINVALMLGRPLFVSGEPGCGKTELGFSIARKLKISHVHFFATKSDSNSSDIFYQYDALDRFRSANSGEQSLPSDFISYSALGRAILDAYGSTMVNHLDTRWYSAPKEPIRSVVILDEIDKAPRDFSNNLLNEIERLWFRVPELTHQHGRTMETPSDPLPLDKRPIVVVTSNSEQKIPHAFLRRCVFHHIAPITGKRREDIVKKHLLKIGTQNESWNLNAVFSFVDEFKEQLNNPLGLAEIIDFVVAIASRARFLDDVTDLELLSLMGDSIGTIAKNATDQEFLTSEIAERIARLRIV